jgi:hypothetical protein
MIMSIIEVKSRDEIQPSHEDLPRWLTEAYRGQEPLLFRAVSKRGETDKYLYLQLKSAGVSPFHGFGGTVGVI